MDNLHFVVNNIDRKPKDNYTLVITCSAIHKSKGRQLERSSEIFPAACPIDGLRNFQEF